MKRYLVAFAACLALGGTITVNASPLSGVEKVGQAKLEVLFWDVYESSLYSVDGKFAENRFPVVLDITYLRDIDAEDLIEQTEKEWNKLDLEKKSYEPWLKALEGLWPNIKKGDSLTFRINADGTNAFYFNKNLIGNVEDKAFGPRFLDIWLNERASYPKLRKQLLGQSK